MPEYVPTHEIVYCSSCGCIIPSFTLVDSNDPKCPGCEFNAK